MPLSWSEASLFSKPPGKIVLILKSATACHDLQGIPRPPQGSHCCRTEKRRGAGQIVAPGPAQTSLPYRHRLLWKNPLRPGRVRLLGVPQKIRKATTPLLELPEGRRRRNHRRHALPLAVRDPKSLRRNQIPPLTRSDATARTVIDLTLRSQRLTSKKSDPCQTWREDPYCDTFNRKNNRLFVSFGTLKSLR